MGGDLVREVPRGARARRRVNKMRSLRMSDDDIAMLNALAAHEERTWSDTVRRMIRHAFNEAKLKLPTKKAAKR